MPNFNPKNPTKFLGTNKFITFFVSRNRQPTGADFRQPETGTLYSVGTVWQVGKNPTSGTEGDLWMLSKIVANVGYWIKISSGVTPSGSILSISDTANTLVFPTVGGNIQIEGTAGQIVVTSSPGSNKLVLSLSGGGGAIDSVGVDAATGPGTNPVVPTALGLITVTGGQIAAGSTVNVIRTNSLAANTYKIEVQRSSAQAVSTVGANGVAHFLSTDFAVDGNGFVNLQVPAGSTVTSVSGTANRITSTGGTTPTIDISASYVGQSSITTVGTLSSGTVPTVLVLGAINGAGPAAGYIGQNIRSTLDFASKTGLSTGTAKTVTSISLTAGVWDVVGVVIFFADVTTDSTAYEASISATNNTPNNNFGYDTINFNTEATTAFSPVVSMPVNRINIASTITYYLIARSSFVTSTMSAYGTISATRVG